MGAVIDDRAFAKHKAAITRAKRTKHLDCRWPAAGRRLGGLLRAPDRRRPRPTRPTRCSRPSTSARSWPCTSTTTSDFEKVVRQLESVSPYALTGAIISQDRAAIAWARKTLRFAAGNFYINDKPTGAVVGQQPFGGARASGTNDKAGAAVNLLRWTSPRSIKETFVPPTDHHYPYMG